MDRKQQNRAASSATANQTTSQNHNNPARRWFTSVGFGAILIGAFGLLNYFFWWSVGLVLLGLLSLLADLMFERFRLRFVIMLFIVIVGVAFVRGVVFAQDPLTVGAGFQTAPFSDKPTIGGITWTPDIREIDVVFQNNTGDDLYGS